MPSSSDPTFPRFAVRVRSGGRLHLIDGNDAASKVAEVTQPLCQLDGWFLPTLQTGVQGIRIKLGSQEISARRKQLRPDILRRFPDHPEALLSGFKAELHLRAGLNKVQFEFKDGMGQWRSFGTCRLRLARLWKLREMLPKPAHHDDYAQWLRDYELPSAQQLLKMTEEARAMKTPPPITVLLRTWKNDAALLERSIESLRAQAYPFQDWVVVETTGNSISEPSPKITGSHVTFLDEGDMLAPHALFLVAQALSEKPDLDLTYSDEDALGENGTHVAPRFKGSWDRELVRQSPFAAGLLTLRTSLFLKLGGRNTIFEQDHRSLLLGASDHLTRDRIRHLPRVLYHRNGAAIAIDGDPKREPSPALPSPAPFVSLIVPTHNRVDLLRVALDTLFAKTSYERFEIIVIDHASTDPGTLAYLRSLHAQHGNVRVIRAEGPFNWSRLNNLGAKEAKGDVLLFLNNDVEIINGGWLRELAAQASRPDVGAVGACLLYPDGSIQHAGIVLGMTGLAGHVFRTLKPGVKTMAGSPDVLREVTAVTGACLAVRRTVFKEAGGFDEELAVGYNDVDFCLKLRARGLRNLYTPYARLIHHESVSRRESEQDSLRKAAASEEARIVLKRWPTEFQQDAFYSPNLSLEHEIPTLGNPPPRLSVDS